MLLTKLKLSVSILNNIKENNTLKAKKESSKLKSFSSREGVSSAVSIPKKFLVEISLWSYIAESY